MSVLSVLKRCVKGDVTMSHERSRGLTLIISIIKGMRIHEQSNSTGDCARQVGSVHMHVGKRNSAVRVGVAGTVSKLVAHGQPDHV